MHLSTLSLTDVRQFEERTFEFAPGFNLLIGENGHGKTTIIRALLAAVGGSNQTGLYPKLADEDIRLNRTKAEVEAEVLRSDGIAETFSYQKRLWESPFRSHTRSQRPLVLSYASNEATCSSLKVKAVKRVRGTRDYDSRRDEEFLFYGDKRAFSKWRPDSSGRQFGNSSMVREFVGRVLSTFSPDFRDFYWRFEPYDCSLVLPPGEPKEEVFEDNKTEKKIRSAALRYFQEGWFRRRQEPYEWPDQEKVILYPRGMDGKRREDNLPDPYDVWEEIDSGISAETREVLQDLPLEVKLTPRIMIRREDGSLSLKQLSDGEQRLFSLFVDIARQLSLQEKSERRHIGGGKAIVLIDEIDVHLHPKWQRRIVPALEELFPDCQFIATTHSPFVIQSIRSDSQLVLLDGQSLAQLGNTGIEEIAQVVMGVDRPDVGVRYAAEVELAKSFLQLLDEADAAPREKLKLYIDRLAKKLDHAENPAMQAFLELRQASRLGDK